VFSENRDKYIGISETASGIGLMVGPIFGGFLYNAFGYFNSFLIFGILLVINLIVTIFITPSYLNKSTDSDNDQETNGQN
jgi:MFS family permease